MTKCTKDEVPNKEEKIFFREQIKYMEKELKNAKKQLKQNPRLRNAKFTVEYNTEKIDEMKTLLKRKIGKDICQKLKVNKMEFDIENLIYRIGNEIESINNVIEKCQNIP